MRQADLEQLYARLEKPMFNVAFRWTWNADEAQAQLRGPGLLPARAILVGKPQVDDGVVAQLGQRGQLLLGGLTGGDDARLDEHGVADPQVEDGLVIGLGRGLGRAGDQ